MQLNIHEGSGENWAILATEQLPFIVGNSRVCVDWHCQACGVLVAKAIHPRQILDVLIRCAQCSALLQSTLRKPGDPIAGRPVYLGPGTYRIGGCLDVKDKPVMMVGPQALVGYAQETGRAIPEVYQLDMAPGITDLEGQSLLRLADQLRMLLGDNYEKLQEADDRGRRSSTPPPRRQRLIELIEFVDKASIQLRDLGRDTREIVLSGDLLAESITAAKVADRWHRHPAWPALQTTLISSTEAEHTIMLLAIASYLVDANNGVGLHVHSGRTGVNVADIWLEPNLDEKVDLELKTPLAIRAPSSPLNPDSARKIIERALKKSSRQRGNTRTSLLALGGYHLGESFPQLQLAATRLLHEQRQRWKGLAGVLVADSTYQSAQDGSRSTNFTPILRVEFVGHPGYRGGITVAQDQLATAPLEQAVPRGADEPSSSSSTNRPQGRGGVW